MWYEYKGHIYILPEILELHGSTKNSHVTFKTMPRSPVSTPVKDLSDANVVSIWWLYLNFLWSYVPVAVFTEGQIDRQTDTCVTLMLWSQA